MSSPGTKSYECVRRNWHSDRHQPMRGSIIQQLFWVLHESHSPVTKKEEWQEKLPILVLKAEEIMYSKANSEAEYIDFQTLWERVNDAVNTIMKRDESTETKDLLPPCVEACLNLSCVPVKASRSYLGPKSSKITKNPTQNQNLQLPHLQVNQSNLNSPRLSTNSKQHILPVSTSINNISPNVGSVYPLYYDNKFRKPPENTPFLYQIMRKSNPIIVSTPEFPSMTEPPIQGCFQNPYLETNYMNNHKKKPEPEFDLSLRLGLFKEPFVGPQKGQVIEINTSNDPSGFGTSRWSFEGQGHGKGPASKKRKVLFDI